MRKLFIIFVSFLIILNLLTFSINAEDLKVNFDTFWNNHNVVVTQVYPDGAPSYDTFSWDPFPQQFSNSLGYSYKVGSGFFADVFGFAYGETFETFRFDVPYPEDTAQYKGGSLDFCVAITGYKNLSYWGITKLKYFYYDDNGQTIDHTVVGTISSLGVIDNFNVFRLHFDLPQNVRYSYFECEVSHSGHPAFDAQYLFGVSSDSYFSFLTVTDEISSSASQIHDDLEQAAVDLEVPLVDPSDTPDVSLPTFSFQSFYSTGTFIPFMTTCSALFVSLSVIAYIVFGKKG